MQPSYDTLRAEAVQALVRVRRALDAEISAYPTPISGCDAQFNHLLAERQRLARAADALQDEVFIPTPRIPEPARIAVRA
jgi:hypothetical protein